MTAEFKVSVIASSRIPHNYAAVAKPDRQDAMKLAICFTRELLHSVAIPTVEQEGYRALLRRRKPEKNCGSRMPAFQKLLQKIHELCPGINVDGVPRVKLDEVGVLPPLGHRLQFCCVRDAACTPRHNESRTLAL